MALSLPELCCAVLYPALPRPAASETVVTPPPSPTSFFPRWACARFTHSRTHFQQSSSCYSVPSTPGVQAQEPVWFPLDGGSTRTSWSFLCVHISWGKLIVDYLWRSLHFAGLALRSLDPSSDCLSDNIPLGVCIIVVGM